MNSNFSLLIALIYNKCSFKKMSLLSIGLWPEQVLEIF